MVQMHTTALGGQSITALPIQNTVSFPPAPGLAWCQCEKLKVVAEEGPGKGKASGMCNSLLTLLSISLWSPRYLQ